MYTSKKNFFGMRLKDVATAPDAEATFNKKILKKLSRKNFAQIKNAFAPFLS